ncbi:MltA domain-containing protein [Candidatus Babeliales bacterium]|nr:MltA domain-containing protein [Candidatus Babeliales bacterium]
MKYMLLSLMIVMVSKIYSVARFQKIDNPSISYPIKTDPHPLRRIAYDASNFLKKVHLSNYVTADEGLFKGYGIALDDVTRTLDFVVDTATKKPELLKSHWFLKKHFDFYRWYGDEIGFKKVKSTLPVGDQTPPEAIRITKYRITKIHGSYKKTRKYTIPVYQKPSDEHNVLHSDIAKNRSHYLRFHHTKDEILNGVLEHNQKTKLLAWVTPEGYADFKMQGSLVVALPDKNNMLINVAGTNGKEEGQNYWFAAEVKNPSQQKTSLPVKVRPISGVSFAGNIKDLGFGKLIALEGKTSQGRVPEMRLGVLVDTGNAFKKNLFQLDLFSGYFETDKEFTEYNGKFPEAAHAYVLIKKKG